MEPLIIGLLGALIGAGASIAAVWVQSVHQTRRERMRLVVEMATQDYKASMDLALASGKRTSIPPVAVYLHYHLELARQLEKGSLTSAKLVSITKENSHLADDLRNINE